MLIVRRTIMFLILTVFTQVGGIIYLLTIPLRRPLYKKLTGRWQRILGSLLLFILSYLFATLLIVPVLAKPFGRVPLPMTREKHLQPQNIFTCLLNRNYVRPALKEVALQAATDMNREFPGTEINYLDASFPFINKFPLFPHLSHNDGKKLDLSFCYLDSKNGAITNKTPSFIGYGICEEPRPGEKDQPCICREAGYWGYSLMRRIVPQGNKQNFVFDSVRTKALVLHFIADSAIGRIFIEPHLKTRLGLNYDKIRYHGCHAVRHDDHIHIQLH